MQPELLISLLQQPGQLKVENSENLRLVIKQYPYFQPAHALYLKALKNKESYKYNNALKVTAAHTTDRSVLFDFITSEVFNQNSISEQIKQNSEYIKSINVEEIEDISVNKSVTIDNALKAHIAATEGVLDPDLFKEKASNNDTKNPASIPQVDVENITPEEQLNIGKPLDFDASETHSFMEWLKITSFKPIDRNIVDDNKDAHSQPLMNKLDAIDKFIAENPKIQPIQSIPKPKLISDHTIEDSLMTETLARIYLEQKDYKKAIQSYRILSLKYPEKSSFFADQIKAIEELKHNDND